jgi:uncharacterized protein involved in response to NO
MSAKYSVPSAAARGERATRDFLGLLGAGFYGVFTLLPDSSSLVVSWPWVLIWQVALFLPWLWLLRQWWRKDRFMPLGFGLDYGAGFAVAGLGLSALLADFPQQARWYGWAALCGLAALYALNDWTASSRERRRKLLTAQGGLSLVFIAVSLLLWISQTVLPELHRLQELQALGLSATYDFSVLELRNWAPIGHQNYVAGYLILTLPLLVGLGLSSNTPWRWLWGVGAALGLVDLYSTSSRGGWIGLAAAGLYGIALYAGHSRISARWRWVLGLGLIGLLGSLMAANTRLRSLFSLTPDGAGGELAFRLITNATGWAMGLSRPWLGHGPGSVPLLYQAYRPAWAGREAELVYQLHSTPAQLWAELGIWGAAISLGLMGWLVVWGFCLRRVPADGGEHILCWSLLAGLLGYGVMSLTDYQLDIIAVTGTLTVYIAGILSWLREAKPSEVLPKTGPILKGLRWGTVGLLLAVSLWLAPIHRAWQLSSLGFNAIATGKLDSPSIQTFTIGCKQPTS